MSEIWIFGYGSLMWNPGFSYERKETCFIKGWERRFWQESSDHRGTVSMPGRVATIILPALLAQAHTNGLTHTGNARDCIDRLIDIVVLELFEIYSVDLDNMGGEQIEKNA